MRNFEEIKQGRYDLLPHPDLFADARLYGHSSPL